MSMNEMHAHQQCLEPFDSPIHSIPHALPTPQTYKKSDSCDILIRTDSVLLISSAISIQTTLLNVTLRFRRACGGVRWNVPPAGGC